MYIYIFTILCVYIYIYIYIQNCVCVCVCIYIYIYIVLVALSKRTLVSVLLVLYHVRVVMCLHAGFCRGRDSFAASGILLDSRSHVITLSSGFYIQSYESYLTVGDVLLFLPVYFIFAKQYMQTQRS